MIRGVCQLGHLAFEVADLDAWRSFAADVLGLGVAEHDGGLSLCLDDHRRRFFVHEGGADDLVGVGWQCADEDAFEQTIGRLRRDDVAVHPDEALAARRGVARLARFRDPGGTPCELTVGPAMAQTPFSSPLVRSGFVAGAQGLGHCVVNAPDKADSHRFYTQVLGFSYSDSIVDEIYGHPVDLHFFHVNPRHHTVAFGGQLRKGIHHFMLEVASIDDVGLAYDRCLRAGVRIMQTLGRHPNDRMISFYVQTPSGFQVEYGCNGRQVDAATWEPTTHNAISEWGHHPPQVSTGELQARPAK